MKRRALIVLNVFLLGACGWSFVIALQRAYALDWDRFRFMGGVGILFSIVTFWLFVLWHRSL